MQSNKKSDDTIIRRAVTEFLNNSECRLATPPEMFVAIYGMTNGQPCIDCTLKPCNLLTTFKNQDKQPGGNSSASGLTNINRRDISVFTIQDGCKLAETMLFNTIYDVNNGYPCVSCAFRPCYLYDKLKDQDKRGESNAPKVHACDLKTNAELAAIHGISKRQVAKRRITGTNDLRDE